MREAVIVAAARTAVGKAPRGTLKDTRPDEMAAVAIAEAVKRAGIEPGQVDDVILGCAFPEGEQGMNVARVALTRAGLPSSVPGMTINRFCSSGLQAIAIACEKVMCGFADIVVAGGTESMSMIPMGGLKQAPNPHVIETYPQLYMAMGLTAEEVAKRWKVSREDQDAFALASHQKAAAAIEEGRFKGEIVPLKTWVRREFPDGSQKIEEVVFEVDEGVRPDTTLEALSKLKPAFALKGTVTAGNSSQMSDGAAAVVVMSDKRAAELGIKPMAVFRGYAAGGVDPDIMGIGPTVAIPKVMKITGLKIEDMDLVELNEAFAAQSLACIRILGMEEMMERINVNGGAIALGHPLGCTGAKLTVTILYEMARRNAKYGLVSMCIGGGMGAAGIFERV
ncbi:MAG: acetyl-CoA C-acyltransferase [Aquificota bacterium]|nr:MAG: acetyl-CoA C-acyltransferase [Aquificota bacterium]